MALPQGYDMIEAIDTVGFSAAVKELTERDPSLAAVVRDHGVPPFWHRPPGFATLVLFIVEQQVSLASARAVFERLVTVTGGITPERIQSAGDDVLASSGLTRQKLRYIRILADLVAMGDLDIDGLEALEDATVRERLLAVTGIGPWTADVYLLSALRRPDVWPVGDRALQVATGEALDLVDVPTPDVLEAIGSRWRPWRAVAARLLWHSYLSRRGREEPVVGGLDGSPLPA